MVDSTALHASLECILDVSACIASRDGEALRRALQLASVHSPPAQVDEVILQSHLFVGFPIALEAMVAWRGVRHPEHPVAPEEAVEWGERGSAVCRTVYGDNYDKLRQNVQALHPAMDRWMVEHGYGRVIGRAGLPLAERELSIVALLAVWGAPRQLHSHLRGALNAGAAPEQVETALKVAGRHLAPSAAADLAELWARVRR